MRYLQHDAPAAPVTVLPERDGDEVDLSLYSSAAAELLQPDGSTTAASAALDVEDGVIVTLPELDQVGIVQLVVRLSTAAGRTERFTAEPVVVEVLDGWHTIESAQQEAPGLGALDDVRLFTLLASAKRDCVIYHPDAGTRRPLVAEREAQLMQARNRNAAARVDPASGNGGVDGYSVGAFPLDWAVKALLRPKRRFGGIR